MRVLKESVDSEIEKEKNNNIESQKEQIGKLILKYKFQRRPIPSFWISAQSSFYNTQIFFYLATKTTVIQNKNSIVCHEELDSITT